jgi:hypothetical protein
MEPWNGRVAAAAKQLGLTALSLADDLAAVGVEETSVKGVTYEDFKAEMLKVERVKALPGASIKLGLAFKLLPGATPALSEDAPPGELLANVNLQRPDDASRKAVSLLKGKRVRSDEARTWGEVHFVVLADDGAVDRQNTAEAMAALAKGDQDFTQGTFATSKGDVFAVFRLDDLTLDSPRALRLRDPLDIGAALDSNKASRKFSVVVDLDADRHQLLLFALLRGLKAAPRDAGEASALVTNVRSASSVVEAAKGLGKNVEALWKAARRAPPGSPAALPSITESGPATVSSSAGAGGNGGDLCDLAAGAISEAESDNIQLSVLPKDMSKALLMCATARDLEELLRSMNQSPQKGKDQLAQQVISANPPLEALFHHAVIDADNMVKEAAFSTVVPCEYTDLRNEMLWRVFAKSALKLRK